MTAQTPETRHETLNAYVFVVNYVDYGGTADFGMIASSVEEALAELEKHFASYPRKLTFFNAVVAVMQPAIIEYWCRNANGRDVCRVEEGFYAFLRGIFFCKCGDHEVATHCKQEKTRTGWFATIYGNNHDIKPL